jgi:hypothetical protein
MFGTTASKVAASLAAVTIPALGVGIVGGSVAAIPPPPSINTGLDPNVLLVATLANGQLETHWLPRKVCSQIVAALRAGNTVAGIRFDGTRMMIDRANCSLRSAQLSEDRNRQ